MRYIYMYWKYNNDCYSVAHDFGCEYTTQEVAEWMRYQLEDEKYPTFAFTAISKERYDWYERRKLTTRNFE